VAVQCVVVVDFGLYFTVRRVVSELADTESEEDLRLVLRSSCSRKSEFQTSESEVSGCVGTPPQVAIPSRTVGRSSPTANSVNSIVTL